MKQLLRLWCLLIACAASVATTVAAERPNVLFIISDDLNTALSGMGHPECRTPNLDELVKSGVTFTRAFCQLLRLLPSRLLMSVPNPFVKRFQFQFSGNYLPPPFVAILGQHSEHLVICPFGAC